MAGVMDLEKEYGMGVYPKRDIVVERGKGEFIYDKEGREYIDCIAGHGVANIGHCHPKVVEAIKKQAETLITCPGSFYNETRAELLRKLAEITPGSLKRSFLCNSGAEAVEGAMKLARAHTKKKGFIAAMGAFHGRTMGALSLTYKKYYKEPFEPLIGPVTHVHYGVADDIRKAIDNDTAAVFLEPIQGEGGVRIPPGDYLKEVREICDEKGVLLVLDEVQTGFGRTGKMFACGHWGVVPDILCVAKSIGGGIPMGAVIAREEVCSFKPLQHATTFGGNPLACASSIAFINAIIDERLCERAASLGAYLLERLKEFEGKKEVRDARGLGLMLGIELKKDAREHIRECAERGLLVLPAGGMVIRLLPPLVISRSSVDKALSILDEVLM